MQSQVWATLRKTQLLYGAKLSAKTSGWAGGGLVSAHSFSHPWGDSDFMCLIFVGGEMKMLAIHSGFPP